MFKKLNLFSKTEMKILSFISGKDGELYEREIAMGARVSAGSANLVLKKFLKLGLVMRSKKGKMSFYRRNDGNPLLRQYKISLTVDALMPLVAQLMSLCGRIILFGSCAEGRNGENSDIDLFILSGEKDKVRRLAERMSGVQPIILNGSEYAELRRNDKPLYDRINAGIELYGEVHG